MVMFVDFASTGFGSCKCRDWLEQQRLAVADGVLVVRMFWARRLGAG